MKTIAHIHADLLDMEDGVKGHTGLQLSCAGMGINVLHIISNVIRVAAREAGIPVRVYLELLKDVIPLEAEAEYQRVTVDADAIEKLKKER